jgi:hypothetical protein
MEDNKEQIIANRKHNQQYLLLDDIEILLHEKLMGTSMMMYPKSLLDYLNKNHTGDSVCGDAISCWVANWIKTLRKDSQEDKLDKRCGTCQHYNIIVHTCTKDWRWMKSKGVLVMQTFKEMDLNDGENCPDWKDKPTEKIRVWTCLNCNQSIYFDTHASEKHQRYFHYKSNDVRCNCTTNQDSGNMAIPRPDSETWIETDCN